MAITPYESAATEVLGESALPRSRTFFTPAAFGRSMDIVTRANLAKRDLNKAIGYAKQENDIRGLLLDRQEQDLRSVQFEQRRALEEMQPQVRADLESIDPFDDDAFEALTNVEGLITQPQDLRRVRAMRTLAGMYRRQKEDAIEKMAASGLDDDEMADVIAKADEQVKAGDPYAFSKVMAPVIEEKRKKYELDREVKTEEDETKSLLSALAQRGTTEEQMNAALAKAKEAYAKGDKLSYRKAAAVLPPYNDVQAEKAAARRAPREMMEEVDTALKAARKAMISEGVKESDAAKPNARELIFQKLPSGLTADQIKAFKEDPKAVLASFDRDKDPKAFYTLSLIDKRLDALEAYRQARIQKEELEEMIPVAPAAIPSENTASSPTPPAAPPSGSLVEKYRPKPKTP